MDLGKIRSVFWPVGVFVILFLVVFLLFKLWTGSPAIVRSDVAANIAAQFEQQEPADDSAEAVETTAANPVAVQTELHQQNIFSGLVRWTAVTLGLSFALAVAWCFYAAQKERSVFGPKGQSSLMWLWILAAIVYLSGALAAFFLVLYPLDLPLAPTDLALAAIGTGLAGLLGYWLATTLGASPVMRPSVPFSFLLAR